MIKKYAPVFFTLIWVILLYAIHKTTILFLDWSAIYSNFHYSLETLYTAFGLASLLIIFILIRVKQRNFDQIGMAFMVLITVKMATLYFVFKPVISNREDEMQWERTNFIILFMAFLILETLTSAKILKSTEPK